MKGDFIPTTDGELVTWLTNHKAKLDVKGAALGFTAAQITAQKALCDGITASIGTVASAKTTYEGTVTNKNQLVAKNVLAIRNFAKDAKRSATYTVGIGNELGIVSSATSFEPAAYKSKLKVEAHPGYLLLKFSKKGAEGINLYTRLKGELEWHKLSFFGHSPCVDARPLAISGRAENREYMCIGIVKDKEIGLQSDIVSVAYAG